MLQILYLIPATVGGVPLFGWGVLAWLWMAWCAGLLIYRAVKRDTPTDLAGSLGKAYNEGVALCNSVKDGGTRELMAKILVESEEHVDWLETQLSLIGEVGLANYLQSQMGEHEEGH